MIIATDVKVGDVLIVEDLMPVVARSWRNMTLNPCAMIECVGDTNLATTKKFKYIGPEEEVVGFEVEVDLKAYAMWLRKRD